MRSAASVQLPADKVVLVSMSSLYSARNCASPSVAALHIWVPSSRSAALMKAARVLFIPYSARMPRLDVPELRRRKSLSFLEARLCACGMMPMSRGRDAARASASLPAEAAVRIKGRRNDDLTTTNGASGVSALGVDLYALPIDVHHRHRGRGARASGHARRASHGPDHDGRTRNRGLVRGRISGAAVQQERARGRFQGAACRPHHVGDWCADRALYL